MGGCTDEDVLSCAWFIDVVECEYLGVFVQEGGWGWGGIWVG